MSIVLNNNIVHPWQKLLHFMKDLWQKPFKTAKNEKKYSYITRVLFCVKISYMFLQFR